jgi:hypothetical protein
MREATFRKTLRDPRRRDEPTTFPFCSVECEAQKVCDIEFSRST